MQKQILETIKDKSIYQSLFIGFFLGLLPVMVYQHESGIAGDDFGQYAALAIAVIGGLVGTVGIFENRKLLYICAWIAGVGLSLVMTHEALVIFVSGYLLLTIVAVCFPLKKKQRLS